MCTCFYTLAKVISISNMSVLHQCQFDELSSSVGSLCLLATLQQTCIAKCPLPSFCSPMPLFVPCLGFLHNPIRQKKKRSVHFHITFSNILRPSPPSAWRGWCWCERIVSIFSFIPSGSTRPCAALIILLIRFLLSLSPSVLYRLRFFIESLFFSALSFFL